MRRTLAQAALVLFLLATACGSPSSSGGSSSPDAQAEVRLAAPEDQWPVQGDGFKSTTFAYPLNFNVYEPLIYLGSDYSLKPGLAERWELVPPGTWRFHLRHGVKFHDGHDFTADDVMWTWAERQLQGKTLSTVTNTLGPNSVKKVDDFTIDFTPQVTNLRLPEQIVHPEGAIVERGKHFDSSPFAGSGPFRVVEYRPGERAVFERFDGYWGARAGVKRMVVRFLPDPQTRLAALKAGEVDLVIDTPAETVPSLSRDQATRIVKSNPGRNQLIYVNKSGKPPHDLGADSRIRQAVQLAVDRTAYVSTVFEGNADPGRWMAPRPALGKYADQVKPLKHDPGQANKQLEDAGWKKGADGIRAKDGRRLTLDVIGWAEVSSVAFQVLQAELKEVGIEANIKKAADTPTYSNMYRNNDFDLDLEVPNQNDGNPAFLPVLRMYSKNTGTANFAPGGEFDTWAEKALAAPNRDEVQRASAEMMQILNDSAIVAPLAGVRRIYAMKKRINLGDPHPSQTNQVWVSLVAYKSG